MEKMVIKKALVMGIMALFLMLSVAATSQGANIAASESLQRILNRIGSGDGGGSFVTTAAHACSTGQICGLPIAASDCALPDSADIELGGVLKTKLMVSQNGNILVGSDTGSAIATQVMVIARVGGDPLTDDVNETDFIPNTDGIIDISAGEPVDKTELDAGKLEIDVTEEGKNVDGVVASDDNDPLYPFDGDEGKLEGVEKTGIDDYQKPNIDGFIDDEAKVVSDVDGGKILTKRTASRFLSRVRRILIKADGMPDELVKFIEELLRI